MKGIHRRRLLKLIQNVAKKKWHKYVRREVGILKEGGGNLLGCNNFVKFEIHLLFGHTSYVCRSAIHTFSHYYVWLE